MKSGISMDSKPAQIPFRGLFETDRKGLFIFLAGLAVFRLLVMAFSGLELSGDEAHYWQWSQRLDWCYYSKPPGVAVLIWIGTHLFGNTEIGVRCLAVVLSFGASVMMYLLGKRLYNEKTGVAAAVLYQLTPLFSAFGMVMTPDTPLLFFWVCSLYFMHRAWADNKPGNWLLLTCSLGVALLCKYAIVFFYLPAFLFLMTNKTGRKRLCTAWPYLSFALSFVFFIPVLYWNSQHGWVMFKHDMGHASLNENTLFSFTYLMNFLGSQIVVVTPVAFFVILTLLIKKRRQAWFSFWFSVPILIGFLIKSTEGKIQANWPMPAWIAGLFPLAYLIVHEYKTLKNSQKLWINWAVGIGAWAAIVIHILPFVIMWAPMPEKNNPFRKIVGWRNLGREVQQIRGTMEQPYFIFADYYMTASELAFYLPDQPFVYCASLGTRMNQYDVWDGFENRIGENAIYIMRDSKDPSENWPVNDKVKNAFERVEEQELITRNRYGTPLHRFKVVRCYGLKKWERELSDRY